MDAETRAVLEEWARVWERSISGIDGPATRLLVARRAAAIRAALAEIDRLAAENDLGWLHFKSASESLTGVEIERDRLAAELEAVKRVERERWERARRAFGEDVGKRAAVLRTHAEQGGGH